MNHVLFEIGTEEIPARFIDSAEQQFVDQTKQWLGDLRIEYNKIKSYSTPRRIAVLIKGIHEYQTSITEEVRGPSEEIAKDDQGEWTKAAIGFTKGQGMTTEDIYIKKVKGTSYTFVKKHIDGKKTFDLLKNFTDVIHSIQFPETMNWGELTYQFSRPIRWLVALYNERIIPLEVAKVQSSNITYGHRFLGQKITIKNPENYEDLLREQFVIANKFKREALIKDQIKKIEKKQNFEVIIDPHLLQEVRNLVEYPTVFFGEFSDEFLTIPDEVLITSMQEHQRYFPVQTSENKLLPYFIGVRNGDDYKLENVIRGNEKVLQARLADARFFYEEDQKQSINLFLKELDRVVFHEKIGTLHEKTKRVCVLAEQIANILSFSKEEIEDVNRSAILSKFDLVTEMVNEFPELQGIMGEKYALIFSERETVAQAIKEHYLPLQSAGKLPKSKVGSVLSIADKLDTIVGVFSVGMKPTGSQDPYSLRRQAIGILRIIKTMNWPLKIEELLDLTYDIYQEAEFKVPQVDISKFFKQRAIFLLEKENIAHDIIKAVLDEEVGNIHFTIEKAKLLAEKKKLTSFQEHQEAFVRVLNLSTKSEGVLREADPNLLKTDSERKLYETVNNVRKEFRQSLEHFHAKESLKQLEKLSKPIHMFFEHNMVMVEDENLKQNRLSLLNDIAQLINSFAHLKHIQWK